MLKPEKLVAYWYCQLTKPNTILSYPNLTFKQKLKKCFTTFFYRIILRRLTKRRKFTDVETVKAFSINYQVIKLLCLKKIH